MEKTDIKEYIESDLMRYGIKDYKSLPFMVKKELFGYRYSKVLRWTKFYKEQKSPMFFFYRYILYKLTLKYGISIPYSVEIGRGFYIGHKGNITINGGVKIGNNVNISQGVTIGYSNAGKYKGTPKIGNNVFIGTNAVVVGGVEIGNDVVIAPNTFVNFNVPDHSVVIFQKAEIHNKEEATKYYVENLV